MLAMVVIRNMHSSAKNQGDIRDSCHTVGGVLVVILISVSVVMLSTSVGHDGVIVCTVLMLLQWDCCGFVMVVDCKVDRYFLAGCGRCWSVSSAFRLVMAMCSTVVTMGFGSTGIVLHRLASIADGGLRLKCG